MFIIRYKKIFFFISLFMVVVSIFFIGIFGLKLGIDFKGGALLEVEYVSGRPEPSMLENVAHKLKINQSLIQKAGEFGYLIKTRDLSEAEHQALLASLSFDGKYSVSEKVFTSIGPSVG